MGAGVDFALQDLLGAGHGEVGHLLAQLLLGRLDLLLDLRGCGRELAFAFRITASALATGLIFAMVMGLVGGLLPAFRAARLPIASALRAA